MYSNNIYLIYIEEKQAGETAIPINSVAICLQALAQCHDTINELDSSRFVIILKRKSNVYSFFLISSSDSDSDPEGGELPDIPYRKEKSLPRKKIKRKRTEKIVEEHVQRLTRKREVR